MNKGEKKTAKKIARIMRAVRKLNGYNQTHIANHLEISQGALSKYESGSMIPSAHHWVEFCNFTNIPANSYLDGFVDHKKPILTHDLSRIGSFKIPDRFAHDCGSTVRTCVPLLRYYEEVLGTKSFQEYLDSVKMDLDFFTIMDNPININFNLDIARFMIDKGKLKPKDLPALLESVSESGTHGKLQEVYDNVKNPSLLLETAVINSNYYDCNSRYGIEEATRDKVVISIAPEKHMAEFEYKDSTLKDFLCRYKKNWFKSITRYGKNVGSEVEELQCHFQGASRCVYQFNLSQ